MAFPDPVTVRPEDIGPGTFGPDVIAQKVQTVNTAGQQISVHDNVIEMFTGSASETTPGKWVVIYDNPTRKSGWALSGPVIGPYTGPSIESLILPNAPIGSTNKRLLINNVELVQLETGAILLVNGQVKSADLTDAQNTFPGKLLTTTATAVASGNSDLTTTEGDVLGASITVTTTKANATYVASASFYFSMLAASAGIASGKLSVDNAVQPAFANYTGDNATPDRANIAQHWSGTLAAAGNHILKLRGVGSAAVAAQRINGTHTTITVQVFE